MKTALVSFFLCAGILVPAIAMSRTACTLATALDQHYINVKAVSAGGLELRYTVSNLLKDSLLMELPPGWRFASNAGKQDYQDILVTQRQLLAVKAAEAKTFIIKGFCCEASLPAATTGVPYSAGKMAESNLVSLASYLNANPSDWNTQQYAVWSLSDGHETAHITHPNDSQAVELRRFVAALKGEPLPWYTLLKKAAITASGHVSDYPVCLNADIPYTVAQACYSYCYIVDAQGNTVSQIFGAWLQPQANSYHASFHVAGLQKGEYRLILESKELPLFREGFKI